MIEENIYTRLYLMSCKFQGWQEFSNVN